MVGKTSGGIVAYSTSLAFLFHC